MGLVPAEPEGQPRMSRNLRKLQSCLYIQQKVHICVYQYPEISKIGINIGRLPSQSLASRTDTTTCQVQFQDHQIFLRTSPLGSKLKLSKSLITVCPPIHRRIYSYKNQFPEAEKNGAKPGISKNTHTAGKKICQYRDLNSGRPW